MRRQLKLEELDLRDVPAVYTVSPTGTDSTSTTTWKTLQYAADHVQAGDQVVVRAGTYTGFQLTADGTTSSRITFSADPGVLINAPRSGGQDGINLEGADYVTIEGFKVAGVPRAGIRSVINYGVVIRNNNCDQNQYWGILTGFSENILIENNVTTRSVLQHGIYFSNSADNPIIRGNTSWGNAGCGIHMNGDASQTWSGFNSDGIISNALVENNVIYGNGTTGGSGINMDGIQSSRIQNNLLYDNHAGGITLYQIDGGGPAKNNVIANNTVLQASDGRWALTIVDAATGNTVLNNVLMSNASYRGSMSVSADSLSGLVSDYNTVMDRFTTDDGDSRLTLAQWRSATGQDAHSVATTPTGVFVNATTFDLHAKTGGPAINGGIATLNGKPAPAKDLTGASRPAGGAYDTGAYESGGTTTNGAPTANADSYSVTTGQTLNVSAAGVLANDSDPEGDALTAELVTGVAHGSLTLNANGSFTYTPTAGYTGADSFQYKAKDAANSSNTATVSLTVNAAQAAKPKVASVQVNDGSAQRSLVRSITVSFDSKVTLDGGAFAVTRTGGGRPTLTQVVSEVNGKTVVKLTFSGSATNYGSLADGSWTLKVVAARVHLASASSVTMATDFTSQTHRLFGDSDGDRDVDSTDRTKFLAALGQTDAASLATFDYVNDQDVDTSDQNQFNRRFGTSI